MYQSTPCARMAQESYGKFLCSMMSFIFAPSLITAGIVNLALISVNGNGVIVGIIMLLVGLGLMPLGIALCYCMRRDSIKHQAEEPHTIPGQPLVSGSAPPGAIRGHFLEAQPQQYQYTDRPTASAPGDPLNYHQAPPSYTEVTRQF